MTARPGTTPEPFFADTGNGRQFAVVNRPADTPRGSVLFVPPFAEEMNKSRRMAALTAAALARDGWLVLRFDLTGCGDSDGEFADATWQGWLDDLDFWVQWLRRQTEAPLLLWGLRAGALLASAWLQETGESLPLLLWQPVGNGQRHLTQFLRLRAAAEMMDARQTKGVVSQLWETFASGIAVTVAGYTLNPALVNPMSDVRITLPDEYRARVSLLEISGAERPSLSPATEMIVQKWREAGVDTAGFVVPGAPFWQTTEIETVPAAIDASVTEARRLAG
ncbi:hydrolase 2, exosortase A system-associated [Lentisalinibacter orientalis]|uniref:hydrolase 2, exosortase A system-associated n=1 Tax=Lentisalinibacter orientalis TaxID=2992241 RepID=UPI0038643799